MVYEMIKFQMKKYPNSIDQENIQSLFLVDFIYNYFSSNVLTELSQTQPVDDEWISSIRHHNKYN
jgi:hypothetical protein